MVRMAAAVADGIGVPLRVQVWDPLGWWLTAHNVDRLNRNWDLALFDKAMRQAVTCATASWAMASRYEQTYGTPCIPVIASHDAALVQFPPPELHKSDELIIGMAGQFYADSEWLALLKALDHAGWQVAGRNVILKVFGNHPPPGSTPAGHLNFQGWKPQEEVIASLARSCDLLYCPYPFAAAMKEVAELSFPSKIPSYLAAARPIVFHGPSYASPAVYLAEKEAAFVCRGADPAAVYDGLVSLVEDRMLYARLAAAARAAFLSDFTLERMSANVRQFLGYHET